MKRMKRQLLLLFTTFSLLSFGQMTDDFTDGDFTSNPLWAGTDVDYIVNPSFELQLNNSVAATSYLSTPHLLPDLNDREWRFYSRQSFAPSSSNYGRVYLTSSSSDLTSDPDGFYIQLGEAGSNDAVRLFKCVAGLHTELIAGPVAQIAASFGVSVRVVRSSSADWSLYIDPSGGTSFVLAGTINDASALLGTHFGFLEVYTASNADKFFHDNVYVGPEIFDTDPPVLVSAVAISSTEIDVTFDEALDPVSAETTGNYALNPAIGILSATLDGIDPKLVHLTLSSSMANGTTYDLTTNAITDLSTNVSGIQLTSFPYVVPETPVAGDVVINEFMCDPSPVVGLPDVEYVEIYNRSSKVFDLTGWKLGDASSSGTVQAGFLMPGEYAILTATSSVDSFAVAFAVTSFPSLNNSGDNIVLKSDLSVELDSITYTDEWYKDDLKTDGGYSIERINPNDPCTDIDDWAASNDNLGGTPGEVNSNYDVTPDSGLPGILQLVALAPNYLEVYYSEGMDSTSVADAVILTNPSLTVLEHYIFGSGANVSTIIFNESLTPSSVYTLSLSGIADCWMNNANFQGEFALPDQPVVGDIVLNELLFDPVTGGSDYIELYNNSNKLIDLNGLGIANYEDSINNIVLIDQHVLLKPQEYAVFTEDSVQLQQYFSSYVPGTAVEMDLPTYNNDTGTVYLLQANVILDVVSYSDDWHFKLLDDKEGKSLERLDPDYESNNVNNWHTAAESIGFGTPGGTNSQYYPAIYNGTFSYTSQTVSPDSDGFEDVLQVSYQFVQPGFVGTFKIYDDRGRLVASVMNSELLATEGNFIWDGVSDEGLKASIGIYIGVFEAFSVDGGVVFSDRQAFTVAGTL